MWSFFPFPYLLASHYCFLFLRNNSHGEPPPAFHYLPPSPPSSPSFIQFFLSCSWLRSSDCNKPEIAFEKPSDKILSQKKKKRERKVEKKMVLTELE